MGTLTVGRKATSAEKRRASLSATRVVSGESVTVKRTGQVLVAGGAGIKPASDLQKSDGDGSTPQTRTQQIQTQQTKATSQPSKTIEPTKTPVTQETPKQGIFQRIRDFFTPVETKEKELLIGRGGKATREVSLGITKKESGFLRLEAKAAKKISFLGIGDTKFAEEEIQASRIRATQRQQRLKELEGQKGFGATIRRTGIKVASVIDSPKGTAVVFGAEIGTRKQLAERPITSAATFAGFAAGGAALAPIAATAKGATILKGAGIVGSGLFIGSTGLEVARAPTAQAKGEVIGKRTAQFALAAGGIKAGAATVRAIQTARLTSIKGAGTIQQRVTVGKATGKLRGVKFEELSVQKGQKGFSQIKFGDKRIFIERGVQTSKFTVKSQTGKIIQKGTFQTQKGIKADITSRTKTSPQIRFRDFTETSPGSKLIFEQTIKSQFSGTSFRGTSPRVVKVETLNIKTITPTQSFVTSSPKITSVRSPTEFKLISRNPTIQFGKPQPTPSDILKIEGLKVTRVIQPKTIQVTKTFQKGTFDFSIKQTPKALFAGQKATQAILPQTQITKPTSIIRPGGQVRITQPQFSITGVERISDSLIALQRSPATLAGFVKPSADTRITPQSKIIGTSIPTQRIVSIQELKPSTKPIQIISPIQETAPKTRTRTIVQTQVIPIITTIPTTPTAPIIPVTPPTSLFPVTSAAIFGGAAGIKFPKALFKPKPLRGFGFGSSKAPTPTILTAGFGITGKRTRIGSLSGLGIRPIQPKKKKKKKRKR